MPVNPNLAQIVALRTQLADLERIIAEGAGDTERVQLEKQRAGFYAHLAQLEQSGELPENVGVEQVIAMLGSEDEEEAIEATHLLLQKGEQAVKPLIDYARRHSNNSLIISRVARLLGRMDGVSEQRVGALVEYWQAGTATASITAAMIDSGPAALPRVLEMLYAPDVRLRCEAAKVAGWIGQGSSDCLRALLPLLKDPSVEVRATVAIALGQLDAHTPETILILAAALFDQNRNVRQAAAQALYRIGLPATAAMFDLQKAMMDEYDEDIYDEMERTLDHLYILKGTE